MQFDHNIYLGSQSPRRNDLLKNIIPDFEPVKIEVDENYPSNMSPKDVPGFLSQKKSNACTNLPTQSFILITADTVVIKDDVILEKPLTHNDAAQMIRQLSNDQHLVLTGVTIRSHEKTTTFTSKTKVWFNSLEEDEIQYYINNFKPFDKAGAYGIQEWIGMIGVSHIDGSYYNVVGLPIDRLYRELKKFQ